MNKHDEDYADFQEEMRHDAAEANAEAKADYAYEQNMRNDGEYFNQKADEATGLTPALIAFERMCYVHGYDSREQLDYILEGV